MSHRWHRLQDPVGASPRASLRVSHLPAWLLLLRRVACLLLPAVLVAPAAVVVVAPLLALLQPVQLAAAQRVRARVQHGQHGSPGSAAAAVAAGQQASLFFVSQRQPVRGSSCVNQDRVSQFRRSGGNARWTFSSRLALHGSLSPRRLQDGIEQGRAGPS